MLFVDLVHCIWLFALRLSRPGCNQVVSDCFWNIKLTYLLKPRFSSGAYWLNCVRHVCRCLRVTLGGTCSVWSTTCLVTFVPSSPASVWWCTCECSTSCGGPSAWSTSWQLSGKNRWPMPGCFGHCLVCSFYYYYYYYFFWPTSTKRQAWILNKAKQWLLLWVLLLFAMVVAVVIIIIIIIPRQFLTRRNIAKLFQVVRVLNENVSRSMKWIKSIILLLLLLLKTTSVTCCKLRTTRILWQVYRSLSLQRLWLHVVNSGIKIM